MNYNFTEGNEFLDEYIKDKKYIIVSCITNEYAIMGYNWFLHLKNINLHENSLIVALDKKCYNDLLNYNIPCVFLESNVSPETIKNPNTIITKMNSVCMIAKKYEIDIIHCEIDVIFLKNPIEKLKIESNNFDILFASNDVCYKKLIHKTEIINTGIDTLGFCYCPYKKETVALFDLLCNLDLNKVTELLNECEIINYDSNELAVEKILLHFFKKNNIKYKYLNVFEFSNGSIFYMNQFFDKIIKNIYTLHYNFDEDLYDDLHMERMQIKIKNMKSHGHWLPE